MPTTTSKVDEVKDLLLEFYLKNLSEPGKNALLGFLPQIVFKHLSEAGKNALLGFLPQIVFKHLSEAGKNALLRFLPQIVFKHLSEPGKNALLELLPQIVFKHLSEAGKNVLLDFFQQTVYPTALQELVYKLARDNYHDTDEYKKDFYIFSELLQRVETDEQKNALIDELCTVSKDKDSHLTMLAYHSKWHHYISEKEVTGALLRCLGYVTKDHQDKLVNALSTLNKDCDSGWSTLARNTPDLFKRCLEFVDLKNKHQKKLLADALSKDYTGGGTTGWGDVAYQIPKSLDFCSDCISTKEHKKTFLEALKDPLNKMNRDELNGIVQKVRSINTDEPLVLNKKEKRKLSNDDTTPPNKKRPKTKGNPTTTNASRLSSNTQRLAAQPFACVELTNKKVTALMGYEGSVANSLRK